MACEITPFVGYALIKEKCRGQVDGGRALGSWDCPGGNLFLMLVRNVCSVTDFSLL